MITIYKYPIQIVDRQNIELPVSASILHAGLDPQGVSCLWCSLNTEDTNKNVVTIIIVGTGHELPPDAKHYIASFIDGAYVWHAWRTMP